jgi:hypothetical protein
MMENGHMIDKTKIADSPASAGWLAAFSDPPLIPGEDAAAYNELLAQISSAVETGRYF